MMDELKPCPFCGNDKIKVKSRYVRDYSVVRVSRYSAQCTKCHARGKPITGACRHSWVCDIPDWVSKYVEVKTKEMLVQEAIEAWNRRTNENQTE